MQWYEHSSLYEEMHVQLLKITSKICWDIPEPFNKKIKNKNRMIMLKINNKTHKLKMLTCIYQAKVEK